MAGKNTTSLILHKIKKFLTPSRQLWLSLILGIVVGFLLKERAVHVKFIGDIFMRLIKMTIVPLIFVSVAQVFSSIGDFARMGRIAVKCILIYLVTTLITAGIGISASAHFKPGSNIVISEDLIDKNNIKVPEEISIMKVVINMFPSNPFVSFVEGDILQILVFACLFGIAINSLSVEVQNVSSLIESLSKIVFKLVEMVISITPIGIFGIVAYLSGTQDPSTLLSLAKLALLVYGCGFIVMFIVYGGLLMATGLNPIPFFKKVASAQYFAFLTSSSAAAVPLTKVISEKKLGVSISTASLTVPLGAAFNMNGTSLHLGITSVFLAQIYGVDLTMAHYIKIVFLSIMLTIGGAGIPSGSLLMMPMVLAGIGVPAEMITIYVGIDRFLDMMRSAVNVTGDILAGVLVDRTEGTFNLEMYHQKIDLDVLRDDDVQKAIDESKDEMFS